MSSVPVLDPTPPASPRRIDTRPVVLFDLDGTLTPHAGHHPRSLYSAAVVRWQSVSQDRGLSLYGRATVMPAEEKRRIAEDYARLYVHEQEAAAVRTTLQGLTTRGYRLLIVSHNFASLAEAYLTVLGVADCIDWAGSVFVPGHKIRTLFADGALNGAPTATYLDDDLGHTILFQQEWKEHPGTLSRVLGMHVTPTWLGANRELQLYLATPVGLA
jgi:hypothetical protein